MSNKNYTYNGWQNIATIQFKEIISELVDAKDEKKAIMLIADTGLGKTNGLRQFEQRKKKDTYRITMGDSYNLHVLLNKMQELLSLPVYRGRNSKHICLRDITNKLLQIAAEGGSPVFIMDEAENSRVNVFKAIKELYDTVEGKCGIVLIGTPQLTDSLNKRSSGQSIPQLRRRFKAGTRYITPFSKARDMKPFFDAHIPDEKDLQDLLIELCDNYGELHDYLDPFLKHCHKKDTPPTEHAFRLYHKIPKR